jgi:DNA-binding NtrC family response regulator
MNEIILVIDDDPSMQAGLNKLLLKSGYQVLQAMTIKEGRLLFTKHNPDLILLDLKLPDGSGKNFFKELCDLNVETPVIILTAFPDMKSVISLMRAGAFDYLVKPFDLQELKLQISKALEMQGLKNEVAKNQINRDRQEHEIQLIGESKSIQNIRKLIPRINYLNSTVLISGESGTGKEIVAREIHKASKRGTETMVTINCAAIPANLLEAELFGVEKGAYTDSATRKGLFELAHKSTLFLDEIGELPMLLQPKLLRVLESLSFKRLGGTREIQVDVRLIAASNRNFEELIATNRFREDLYYRLNIIPITLPPLRERREDIPFLAKQFMTHNAVQMGITTQGFSTEAMQLLKQYHWPGNIRELKNILERLIIIHRNEKSIDEIIPAFLPPEISQIGHSNDLVTSNLNMTNEVPLSLEEIEKQHISQVMNYCDRNISQTARILGITRNTLKKKLRIQK